MNRVSTHVLDTARGKPAAGVPVRLEQQDSSGQWSTLGAAQTDQDGRWAHLVTERATPAEAVYRLTFDTAIYFAASKQDWLYPVVEITFRVRSSESQYHIPLLLSANGYTTYRGS